MNCEQEFLSCALLLTSCYSGGMLAGGSVKTVSDSIWAYILRHPLRHRKWTDCSVCAVRGA
ncbi:MAG: hypothetical protein IKZ54_04570 [Bacteroidales bacterium]|nr:hypothetical protein [Bacteroidales bacterium]